jgi:hypothetical protein
MSQLSTPWVAGSNPAGIASSFSTPSNISNLIVVLAHRVSGSQFLFPK